MRIFAYIAPTVAPIVLFYICNNLLGTALAAPKIDLALMVAYVCMAVATALAARFRNRRSGMVGGTWRRIAYEDIVFLLFLGAATLTTFSHHVSYHFLSWHLGDMSIAGLARSRVVWFLALSLALSALFLLTRSRRWLNVALPAIFIVAELMCGWALWRLTGGRAIYSDDHPSFMFRIQEFWRSFPWRENYVPFWNAGVVNNVITSSGVPGYALLTAPLRLLSPLPHETHTVGLFLVEAIIAPWCMAWGLRANRMPWRTVWTGALLALFANRAFILWTFHFGTIGFGTAVPMLPAAFLFLYAVAEKRHVTPSTILGLVFSMTFLCQWPPMWMAAAALALAALTSWRRWSDDRRTLVAIVVAATVTLILLAPSLRAVAGGKDLTAYATAKTKHFSWSGVYHSFRLMTGDTVLRAHPLVLIFGLGGMWSIREKPLRRWLAIAMLVLVAIYSIGDELAPRLQLPRMAIAAAMLAAVPAAILAGHLMRSHRASSALLQGSILALLVLGAQNIANLYRGKGVAPFRPVPEFVTNMAGWIRENVPEDGRLLFAGRAKHAYGRGHIAYLPILTGREMMACDYYDFPPGTFEPFYPPMASRREPGGGHAFAVRHGATHVVTFNADSLEWLRSEPDHFEEVHEFGRRTPESDAMFHIFRVKGGHGVFLEGSGKVKADFNRIQIDFGPAPPERAVIAYNWNDRLVAKPPVEIAPFDTGTTLGRNVQNEDVPVRFIEIRPNGAREAVIRYTPRF